MEKVYNIEGVKCGGCAAVVKEKLSDIEGVESVDVDVAEKKLIVVGLQLWRIELLKFLLKIDKEKTE